MGSSRRPAVTSLRPSRTFTNTLRAPPALWLAIAAVALATNDCSTLLAATKQEVASDWTSYEDAVKSLPVIEAHETPRADVRCLCGRARWLGACTARAQTIRRTRATRNCDAKILRVCAGSSPRSPHGHSLDRPVGHGLGDRPARRLQRHVNAPQEYGRRRGRRRRDRQSDRSA